VQRIDDKDRAIEPARRANAIPAAEIIKRPDRFDGLWTV
jgi:hypothetical protein